MDHTSTEDVKYSPRNEWREDAVGAGEARRCLSSAPSFPFPGGGGTSGRTLKSQAGTYRTSLRVNNWLTTVKEQHLDHG